MKNAGITKLDNFKEKRAKKGIVPPMTSKELDLYQERQKKMEVAHPRKDNSSGVLELPPLPESQLLEGIKERTTLALVRAKIAMLIKPKPMGEKRVTLLNKPSGLIYQSSK